MTLEEYREKVNPCFGCSCYDADLGCSMPSVDRWYACPLEPEPDISDFIVMDDKED